MFMSMHYTEDRHSRDLLACVLGEVAHSLNHSCVEFSQVSLAKD